MQDPQHEKTASQDAGDLGDDQLVNQPVTYWTGAAHTALASFVDAEHASLGVTQRHGMTLNRLARIEGGLTRTGLTEALREYMTPQVGTVSTYAEILDDLLDRGWITCDDSGRFTLTDTGRRARARLAAAAPRIRGRIHRGVSDEDYVIALRVLYRMIANVDH